MAGTIAAHDPRTAAARASKRVFERMRDDQEDAPRAAPVADTGWADQLAADFPGSVRRADDVGGIVH